MRFVFLALFIISICNLVFYLIPKKKAQSALYGVFYLALVFANMGYMIIAFSGYAEEALIANKIYYLGSMASMIMLIHILSEMVQFKYKNLITAVTGTCAVLIYALVFTTGYNNLFYTSYSIISWHGMSALVVTHGDYFLLYNVFLVVYALVVAHYIIVAIRHKNKVSQVNTIAILSIVLLSLAAITVQRFASLPFPLLPFVYAINGGLLLIPILRSVRYDVPGMLLEKLVAREDYGVFAFDDKKLFLGASEYVYTEFPCFDKQLMDRKLMITDELPFVEKMMENLNEKKPVSSYYFEASHKTYEFRLSPFKNSFVHGGYFFEIFDVTKERKYTALLASYNQVLQDRDENQKRKSDSENRQLLNDFTALIESRLDSEQKKVLDDLSHLIDEMIMKKTLTDEGELLLLVNQYAALSNILKDEDYPFTEEEEKFITDLLSLSENRQLVSVAGNLLHYHELKEQGIRAPQEVKILSSVEEYHRCVKEGMSKEETEKHMEEYLRRISLHVFDSFKEVI